jgi:glycosyltransferase involved in cell wall biosynthesis
VVLQFHGADQEGDYARSHRLQKFLYRRLFSASRTNLALGNGAAAWLREICPQVPVRVVPNFVETRDVARVANDDVARFAFVGRVGSRKGIYDLLDAVCMFVDEGGHLQVEVLGDGEVEEVRRRVAGDERLRSRVRVHGWCGADEVASVLDECWSLVLPSYAEGLPMAALEAMANGRAVIATRVGEIEDAVADGQSGILIEPGDVHALAKAMQFISSDLERALEFGRCGRQIIARDFSRARVIGLLEDVYRTAANHRPSVSA